MATSDNRVEVALASDETYACGLLVTAASMGSHMSPDVTLAISVLDGGLRDDTFASIVEKVKGVHERTEFQRLRIDESLFAAFPEWAGNRMAYARLLLPELLPTTDHVVYCDTDYLWLTDVTELWRLRDDSVILQSSRDGASETERLESEWHKRNGFPFHPERYCCAGLSFYNLRLFRKEQVIRKIRDFLIAHPDVPFPDQTAMNVVLGERVRLLPQKWQRFSRDLANDDLAAGCAIHFAGEVPWREMGQWIYTITDSMLAWHRFNARLNGNSLWQSLRQWYGAGEIIRRRLLFHVASLPLLRTLFFALLVMARRGVYVPVFKMWCRRLAWREAY